jgi:hypothetical protein
MNRRDAMKALMALPATATITRAAVKPSDVIVIECDQFLSSDICDHIEKQMAIAFPGQKCVVLDRSLRMKIVEGPTDGR